MVWTTQFATQLALFVVLSLRNFYFKAPASIAAATVAAAATCRTFYFKDIHRYALFKPLLPFSHIMSNRYGIFIDPSLVPSILTQQPSQTQFPSPWMGDKENGHWSCLIR